jgi:hypothetical protein
VPLSTGNLRANEDNAHTVCLQSFVEGFWQQRFEYVKGLAQIMCADTFQATTFEERRRVSNVISGGQFQRTGRPIVPIPGLV